MINDDLKIDPEIQTALMSIVDQVQIEDRSVYERFLRVCKKSEMFWRGIQYVFWDDLSRDWRVPSYDDQEGEIEKNIYNRCINIYKAHGESVIAALSIDTPKVLFFPDDADVVDDVTTAKAMRHVAELIQKHNKAKLLFIKSLYILFNQGYVAGYNYSHQSEEYGTVPKPVYGTQKLTTEHTSCPLCGAETGNDVTETGTVTCPGCQADVIPEQSVTEDEIPIVEKIENIGKIRQCMEVYGPLHVKIPFYAQDQRGISYLIFSSEASEADVKETYPGIQLRGTGDMVTYNRWARLSTDYQTENPQNLITVRQVWLRPSQFHRLDDERCDQLTAKYPDGCKVVMLNDVIADVVSEKMDDHWTFSINPLSLYIHSDPLGSSLVPVQEMRNDLMNLKLQTIEYGVPQTFVDSETLDFDKYANSEAKPGMIYPVKARSGMSIEASFYASRTATLTQEAKEFSSELDQDAQFVTGSFPSIYGGPSGGSRTASEYAQSRSQALQRLSTSWTLMSFWWSDLLRRASLSYITDMMEDEKLVKKNGDSFFNVWIRRTDLVGKIGEVVPEFSEKFPVSWSQKQDVITTLMQYQIPELNSVIFSPDNAEFMTQLYGMEGMKIPGEQDRLKQRQEINELLNGNQILPDADVDTHEIHVSVLRDWMNSTEGLDVKAENPNGYELCRMHLRAHLQALASVQQTQMQAQTQQTQQPQENVNGTVDSAGSAGQAV
jgi:hypothetical protein